MRATKDKASSGRSSTGTAANVTGITTNGAATNSSRNIFRGCMFALVRIAPPSNVIDFDTKALEQSIKRNGGQMVSLKLIDALRVDVARARSATRNSIFGAAANVVTASGDPALSKAAKSSQHLNQSSSNKRICYVVCWGQVITQTHLDLNPIISQLYRHKLCHVVLVTPIWLQTCIDVQKMIPPSRFPTTLYTPQTWPVYRYQHNDNRDGSGSNYRKKNIVKDGKAIAAVKMSSKKQTEQISRVGDDANLDKVEATTKVTGYELTGAQKLCISVTGFSNSERVAIRRLLLAMGIEYDGDMGSNCTHLIYKGTKAEEVPQDQRQCTTRINDATSTSASSSSLSKRDPKSTATSAASGADATAKAVGAPAHGTTGVSVGGGQGPKFERAIERGLPVVSIDWLYRLARTGNC